MSDLVAATTAALNRAFAGEGWLPPEVLTLPGYSGRKYRLFINNLIGALHAPRYLEVGVWQGSTLCSAIWGNSVVVATAIDNWSEFGGPRDEFFANLARFRGNADVTVLEQDFRSVDYAGLGQHNVYLFDGPHDETDQRDGIGLALPALAHEFVLIVDDWNWARVRGGTRRGIEAAKLTVLAEADIRTTDDGSHPAVSGPGSDWHNGYFIGVCRQDRRV